MQDEEGDRQTEDRFLGVHSPYGLYKQVPVVLFMLFFILPPSQIVFSSLPFASF